MLMGTLASNKPYLGWSRQTWDPIVFGILLVAVAMSVRRWLLRGVDGHRRGFTPLPLVVLVLAFIGAGLFAAAGAPALPAGLPAPGAVLATLRSSDVPLAGVQEPLKKFSASCFGRS